MKCEMCPSNPRTIVVLPIKRPDGSLTTNACRKCAKKSSAYCTKHKRPHLGFSSNDTTACTMCIEEMVSANQKQSVHIFATLKEQLPDDEFKCLLEWAILSSSVTGNSRAICILRAVATKSMRNKQALMEVVGKVIADRSVNYILPENAN